MRASNTARVARLLASMFTSDELRRFILLHYKEIHDALKWDAPHEALAVDSADALERRGLIDAELHAALRAARPRRIGDIAGSRGGRRELKVIVTGLFGLGIAVAIERGAHHWRAEEPHQGETAFTEAMVAGLDQAAKGSAPPPAPVVAPRGATEPMCPADMVLVTPAPRLAGELPQFCLDVREVSREQYGLRCPPIEHGGVHDQVRTGSAQFCDWDAPDPQWGSYPVVSVSGEEARSFCAAKGRRLPRDREWFAAAMMDLDVTRTRDFLEVMNLCGEECEKRSFKTLSAFRHSDSHPLLAPVGAYRDRFPSRLGLEDMFGNARELVERDGLILSCGSSWRSLSKEYLDPRRCISEAQAPVGGARHDDIGFRCARDVSPRR